MTEKIKIYQQISEIRNVGLPIWIKNIKGNHINKLKYIISIIDELTNLEDEENVVFLEQEVQKLMITNHFFFSDTETFSQFFPQKNQLN